MLIVIPQGCSFCVQVGFLHVTDTPVLQQHVYFVTCVLMLHIFLCVMYTL